MRDYNALVRTHKEPLTAPDDAAARPLLSGPITVRLPLTQLREIDAVALDKGYTRTEFMRMCLRRGVKYADDIPPKQRNPLSDFAG